MGKLITLNKKHETHLTEYMKRVDGFIYEVTENQPIEKWRMFSPLKTEAIRLHNELGKATMKGEINPLGIAEWVFMLPNFLLFGSLGFASALKTPDNVSEINILIEQLYVDMSNTIIELDTMLVEKEAKENRKKTKLKTNNKSGSGNKNKKTK
jgi:hypothetical protein